MTPDEPTKQFLKSLGANLVDSQLPSQPVQAGGTWIIGPGVTRQQIEAALPAIEKTPGTFVLLFQGAEVLKALGLETSAAKIVGDALPTEKMPVTLLDGVGPSELNLRGRLALAAITHADWNSTAGSLAVVKRGSARLLFVQIDPQQFDYTRPSHIYLKLTHNHTRTLLSRLLANAGVPMITPLVDYWAKASTRVEVDLAQLAWQARLDPQNQVTPELAAKGGDAAWQKVQVPGPLDPPTGKTVIPGGFWYRVVFDVPAALLREDLQLNIGTVDDEDWTYVNGKLLGHIGKDTNPQDYYKRARLYRIPKELLKPTGNVLVIRGNNIEGPGGILEGPTRIAPLVQRWRNSFYQDTPVAADDPYRYYRW